MARLLCSSVAFLALSGCSGEPVAEGTVTYRGKPLPTGEIHFIADDGTSRSAVIDSNGHFSVRGVPQGEVTVMVTAEEVRGGGGGSPFEVKVNGLPVKRKSLIPPKYGDRKTSPLSYTIDGDLREMTIELND